MIRLYVDHVGERSRRRQADLSISLALMFSEVGKPITIFVQQGIKFRSRVQTVLDFNQIGEAIKIAVGSIRTAAIKIFDDFHHSILIPHRAIVFVAVGHDWGNWGKIRIVGRFPGVRHGIAVSVGVEWMVSCGLDIIQ